LIVPSRDLCLLADICCQQPLPPHHHQLQQ
jgi:hypothetical protein